MLNKEQFVRKKKKKRNFDLTFVWVVLSLRDQHHVCYWKKKDKIHLNRSSSHHHPNRNLLLGIPHLLVRWRVKTSRAPHCFRASGRALRISRPRCRQCESVDQCHFQVHPVKPGEKQRKINWFVFILNTQTVLITHKPILTNLVSFARCIILWHELNTVFNFFWGLQIFSC